MSDPTTEALLAEIRALRARVDELEKRPEAPTADRPDPAVSRRALFGMAGAGVAGAALWHGASPAAAADGDPIILGTENQVSSSETSIDFNGAGGVNDDAFQVVNASGGNGAAILARTTTGTLGPALVVDVNTNAIGIDADNTGSAVKALVRLTNNGSANAINATNNNSSTRRRT